MQRGKDQPILPGFTATDTFTGFGPSRYRTALDTTNGAAVRKVSLGQLRDDVRRFAPISAGVYGMLGAKGHLIYVGKAKNLRSRLLSYFRTSSDPKAAKIMRNTRTLLWEPGPDEFAALLRELELIRRFRPRFNVFGIPDRRRSVYLCLGRGPATYLYVTRETTGKELAAFGPFVGRAQSHDAVRQLNLEFRLRDCPNNTRFHFAEQQELFDSDLAPKCLRYELGTCLAPCAGYCTGLGYQSHVLRAKAFLDGRDPTLLEHLHAQMQTASREQRFEQAAAWRDRLQSMQWLSEKLLFLRTARQKNSFVYPLKGSDDVKRWYLIHAGLVQAVVREPQGCDDAESALTTMNGVFSNRFTPQTNFERCIDSVLLVSAWFRKRTDQRDLLMTHRQATKLCQAV